MTTRCRRCPGPAAPGRACCRPCQAAETARSRGRQAAHRAAGLCITCDEPAHPGQRWCHRHVLVNREYHRRYKRRLRRKGRPE